MSALSLAACAFACRRRALRRPVGFLFAPFAPQLLRALLEEVGRREALLTFADPAVAAALREYRLQRAAELGLRRSGATLFAGLPWQVC